MFWYYLLAAFCAVSILIFAVLRDIRPLLPDPFATGSPDSKFSEGTGEDDISRPFSSNKVPKSLDVIVIGSGVSGLISAALLSLMKKKVLLVEQHDRAGGMTHVFEEDGFEFDTGLHYVGRQTIWRNPEAVLFHTASEGRLEWTKIGSPFDMMKIKDNPLEFGVVDGNTNQRDKLIEQFPEEKEKINKLFIKIKTVSLSYRPVMGAAIYQSSKSFLLRLYSKIIPMIARNACNNWHKYTRMTTVQVLRDEIGITNQDLIDCLTFNIMGTTGMSIDELPFAIFCAVHAHYNGGAWFPTKGSSQIAISIVPTIRKAGGEVLVRAPVSEIIIENNKAVGVVIHKKSIYAPMVISSIGMVNTYTKILPVVRAGEKVPGLSESIVDKLVQMQNRIEDGKILRPGIGHFYVFVGLNRSGKELKLPQYNLYYFTEPVQKAYGRVNEKKPIGKENSTVFLSFSSEKDSSWESRYPGKSTVVMLAQMNHEWVDRFRNQKVKHRDAEYEEYKEEMTENLLEMFKDLFPQCEDYISHISSGTSLTAEHFFAAHKGSSYGVALSTDRFTPYDDGTSYFSSASPIEGLYLTGSDVLFCGITGAAMSAMSTLCTISQRNLLQSATDIVAEHAAELKNSKKTQ